MNRLSSLLALSALTLIPCVRLTAQRADRVRLGIEVLLEERIDLVRDRRVGLITNPSGVDADLVATADRLHADRRLRLVQLYGPEHGIRGAVAAGEKVGDSRDPVTGLPVESLYGQRKRPSPETLARLDVLLFDIQDVGSRTYTFASTLGEAVLAARDAKIPLIVLDRPNPLGGLEVEGAVRLEKWKSFIGWAPIPVTHGLTLGELAQFYSRGMGLGGDVTVVPMTGWKRSAVWEDTGLSWVPTSPHVPHALQAHLYVATGMIGGITENVNEGVGFTLPFETIAAEFIDARKLAAEMTRRGLPGVRFRPISYVPSYFKFQGKSLSGVQLVLDDPSAFRPLRTAIHLLTALEKIWPGQVIFKSEREVAIHWGTEDFLTWIREGRSAEKIEAVFAADAKAFEKAREPYMIYR